MEIALVKKSKHPQEIKITTLKSNEISSSMRLVLNETMFQPGGAMKFKPLSCLNRGLTLSLNNHF